MWQRLMRKTFAPRRPPVFMEQWPLALVTTFLLVAGVVLAVQVFR